MSRTRGAAAPLRQASARAVRGCTVLVLGAAISLSVAVPAQAHPGHDLSPPAAGPTTPAEQPSYGNGWDSLPPIAGGPRQEHSVATLGEDVYVLGGIVPSPDGGVVTTDRVEVYDTRRGTWSDAAPMPMTMNHPNVAVVAGKVYVVGALDGGGSWEALPNVYVYDPSTDAWSELAPMPGGTERGSAAVGVIGTTMYLAGGMRTLTPGPGGLQDTVDTVTTYDVETGEWGELPNLPEARDHVGGAVVEGTFYVVGGRDRGQENVRDTVYALDLAAPQSWTQRAPMPTPRGGIATAVVGTTIYTFGGEGNPAAGSQGVFDDVEAYSTDRDSWEALAPMPAPRHGTAATTVGKNIYIPGGGDRAGGSPLDVNDTFQPRGASAARP